MLTRCDEENDEEEGDDEGPERLLKGLTHQCSLSLHVQGLPTGFCRDIHGQVWNFCKTVKVLKTSTKCVKIIERNFCLFSKKVFIFH